MTHIPDRVIPSGRPSAGLLARVHSRLPHGGDWASIGQVTLGAEDPEAVRRALDALVEDGLAERAGMRWRRAQQSAESDGDTSQDDRAEGAGPERDPGVSPGSSTGPHAAAAPAGETPEPETAAVERAPLTGAPPCPRCGDLGWHPDDAPGERCGLCTAGRPRPVACGTCGSSGRISWMETGAAGQPIETRLMCPDCRPCAACDGEGALDYGDGPLTTCRECGGHGRVARD